MVKSAGLHVTLGGMNNRKSDTAVKNEERVKDRNIATIRWENADVFLYYSQSSTGALDSSRL